MEKTPRKATGGAMSAATASCPRYAIGPVVVGKAVAVRPVPIPATGSA
ncbi:hypothetical protein ACTU6V_00140 [Microbacterium sp. A204]